MASENVTLWLMLSEQHAVKFSTVVHDTPEQLKQEIASKYEIKHPFELLYFDREFNSYFTLTSMNDVKHLTSVKIVYIPRDGSTTGVANNSTSVLTSPASGEANSTVIISSPSFKQLQLRKRKVAQTYCLPKFDIDIEMRLSEADKKNKETGLVTTLAQGPKSRVLTKLASDLYEKYTAYPSSEEINIVAKKLVEQHPGIRSKVTESGHEGWSISLVFKMGNYRNKMRKRKDPEVTINSGKKSKYNQTLIRKARKGKRGEINFSPSLPCALSEQSCREHQVELIDEMQKASPSKTIIAHKMGLTFAIRRQDINISNNSTPVSAGPASGEANSAVIISSPSFRELQLRETKVAQTYCLPKFDIDIEMRLSEADKRNKETGLVTTLAHGQKSRVLTKLASDLYEKYTAYPSSEEIDIVAKKLVEQHPGIRSRVTESGYEGWSNSLIFKMGNYRNEMRKRKDPEVTINSGKKSKCNQTAPCARAGVRKGKRGEINFSPSLPCALSEQSCREHQAELIDEMQKASPSKTIIARKMGLTFAIRRQDINISTNLPDVLTRWPALAIHNEISREFLRLVNIDLEKQFFTSIDKHLDKLVQLFASTIGHIGKKLALEIQMFNDAKLAAGQRDIEIERTFVLRCLPIYFSEPAERLYRSSEMDATAAAEVSSASPATIYVVIHGQPYASTNHDVNLESVVHASNVSKFSSAMCYMFASHYIFNCQYDDKLSNYFAFIQRVVLEIGGAKKLSSKLLNLLEKLQS